jgi:hypothetical protein
VAPDEEPLPTAHYIRPPPLDSAGADAALGWLDAVPTTRPLVHAATASGHIER